MSLSKSKCWYFLYLYFTTNLNPSKSMSSTALRQCYKTFLFFCVNCFDSGKTLFTGLSNICELGLCISEGQGDQMVWKKSPNIFWKVAKTVAKSNKAKIQTMVLNSLFSWKCHHFGGHFFVSKNPNEPTKSSLTVEKFAQSGHPRTPRHPA